jgi:hypothetical protein
VPADLISRTALAAGFETASSQPAAPIAAQLDKIKAVAPTFKVSHGQESSIVLMRFWIPDITAGLLAVIPWATTAPRFGLRALLVAVTLVAVALGLAVAMR